LRLSASHPHGKEIDASQRRQDQNACQAESNRAEFSTTLVGEVFYREFANRRQLGSYVGLASSPFCSGSLDRDQGISKAGNPKARVMMIELAWTWLRYQPESALSRWFRERVGNLKGCPRRIAIVAMARKLLVALWRYLQTGVVPTGAELKAQSN
jgi:transposase